MDIIEPLISPVVQQMDYIKNLKRNFEELNEKARDLDSKKKDVNHEIQIHQPNKRPRCECLNWLKKVDEIQSQIKAIEEEYFEADPRCSRLWFLNVPSSWKLGRCIVMTTNAILDLIMEGRSIGEVLVDPPRQVVEIKPVLTIENGTSTEGALKKILKCMKDETTQKVGIWGMGGIGKTTIMKNLNNLPEIAEMFQIVIWITVSKDYSIRKLQTEILQRLQLQLLDSDSEERNACKLFQHLSTMKFLLLMDDVWDKVDLDDIGIPYRNQENGSKVVLTTRYWNVCQNMSVDKEIMMEPLSQREAWTLFREKVGEVVDSPNIRPLAERVVRECGGLPLAIVVIGASLRKEADVRIWKNAEQELSSPATSDIYDMELRVFKPLQFSFDRLEDNNARNCFLYAALYPEDHEISISELIEYWRVEGLINCGSALEDVQNRGHVILKRLVNASLLLESSNGVKMHDVLRDLALRITSPNGSGNRRFFVRANKMIKESPKNKEWENVERMSLMRNEIENLPERPDCLTLLTLLLQENWRLRTIPESFFERMHALRVLDLSLTRIESIPHSISNLVSLRGLYLRGCECLKSLPPEIEALAMLEVLDVLDTAIYSLPVEIRQLTRLKVLRVAFDTNRDENEGDMFISGGVISRLSHLEQLRIILGSVNSFNRIDHDQWDRCAEAVTKDASQLKELMNLELVFPKVEYLDRFVRRSDPWKKGIITSFNFFVGPYSVLLSTRTNFSFYPQLEKTNRKVIFNRGDSIPRAIMNALSFADDFKLVDHKSIRSLCEFGMQNMSKLTACEIVACEKMEIIFTEGVHHQPAEAALPNLEGLSICYMPNLRSICDGFFQPKCFGCLKILDLNKCDKLKSIFSGEIIQQLSNLEVLMVKGCFALEVVMSQEKVNADQSDCVLPKLSYLYLNGLPRLVAIMKGCLLNWSSLEEIYVKSCYNLKRLPTGINTAHKLTRIKCDREWWNDLEWEEDDGMIKLQLEPLLS